jgi:dTDP-4-dehydrorhamnose reductase
MKDRQTMIAILGHSGWIGQAFVSLFRERGIPFQKLGRQDVTPPDPRRIAERLRAMDTKFFVNAAGFTGKPNVDACEDHRSDCLFANAVLPGVIRQACEMLELPWGHISSGCIFTGTRPEGSGFRETDAPNFTFRQDNCSFYSGCKALGEEVLAGADRCYVWRIRLPFCQVDGPRNYLSKLLQYQRLVDVRNSLSQCDEVVAACYDCWRMRLPCGTYHLTNGGSVTTRQVVAMMRAYGVTNKTFQFFESEADFLRQAARTPRSNCELDNSKALAAGLRLSPVELALARDLQRWTPRRNGRIGLETGAVA